MLKIVIMIECDSCQQPFCEIRTRQQLREVLLDDIDELQIEAEDNGWMLYRNSTEHCCPACNDGIQQALCDPSLLIRSAWEFMQ